MTKTHRSPTPDRHQPSGPHSIVVPKAPARDHATAVEVLVEQLCALGVEHAFGVFGGSIAPFCRAISESPIRLYHFRHEAGAAFAAIESSLESGKLTVVLSTTGPGVTNLITGMAAARSEGAKVLFVSGGTSAAQRGRMPFQETAASGAALAPLFLEGPLCHFATSVEDPRELELIAARLAQGVARPGGFVAHLGLPLSVQSVRRSWPSVQPALSIFPPHGSSEQVEKVAALLANERFVIWTGFGAREAAPWVRELVRLTGAPVMSTPRGKGTVPEEDPHYLGVTGLGGHESVEVYLRGQPPAWTLVLGTRLGEMSSFWSKTLCPTRGFIHVDVDPEVFGRAFPDVPTLGIHAEISAFVSRLVEVWPADAPLRVETQQRAPRPVLRPRTGTFVRPSYLMSQVQKRIVQDDDGILLTEAGNSFALGSHYLDFAESNRYRVSTTFGSMGHAAAGVLGAALSSGKKAWAIVGDGAMLMLNEVNTAATYGIDAVWIVLNDARYGMIAQGMESVGWEPFSTDFVRADFVAIARGMGADGVRVECEADVEPALQQALSTRGPFVVDVLIDPTEMVPAIGRNQSLMAQGVNEGRR